MSGTTRLSGVEGSCEALVGVTASWRPAAKLMAVIARATKTAALNMSRRMPFFSAEISLD